MKSCVCMCECSCVHVCVSMCTHIPLHIVQGAGVKFDLEKGNRGGKQ